MKPSEFKRRLDELQKVLFWGLMDYALWKALAPTPEKVDILNRFNSFFMPVRGELRAIVIVRFAAVFDEAKGTISLPRLVREAKRDRCLLPNLDKTDVDLRDVERRLSNQKGTIDVVKRLRHEVFAHLAANPSERPKLPIGAFDAFVDEMKAVFNDLSGACRGRSYSWKAQEGWSADDAEEILRILREEWHRTRVEADATRT